MNSILILYICLVVLFVILYNFYRSGKKALSIFPDIKTVDVRYRDKFARGHSIRARKTTAGQADKSLDLIVTDKELWVRSPLLFAGIVKQYDLIHRIPQRKIKKTVREGKNVVLDFSSEKGEAKQLVLITKSPEEFLRAIKGNQKMIP